MLFELDASAPVKLCLHFYNRLLLMKLLDSGTSWAPKMQQQTGNCRRLPSVSVSGPFMCLGSDRRRMLGLRLTVPFCVAQPSHLETRALGLMKKMETLQRKPPKGPSALRPDKLVGTFSQLVCQGLRLFTGMTLLLVLQSFRSRPMVRGGLKASSVRVSSMAELCCFVETSVCLKACPAAVEHALSIYTIR